MMLIMANETLETDYIAIGYVTGTVQILNYRTRQDYLIKPYSMHTGTVTAMT